VLLTACSEKPRQTTAQRAPAAPPFVAGTDAAAIPLEVRGRVLLGELGCVACHAAGESSIDAAAGPRLTKVGERVDPHYLAEFVAHPAHRQPGTVMPQLLADTSDEPAKERARSIAHYLRSLGAPAPAREAIDAAAATRGERTFRRIGCRECHRTPESLAHLKDKYSVRSLSAILLRPHESRPSRRMPDFALSPSEANDLSHHLLHGQSTANQSAIEPVDPARVDVGRRAVAELRCVACHEIEDPALPTTAPIEPKPLRELRAAHGCLSTADGPWPRYALDADQRAAITAAIEDLDAQPPPERVALQMLASRRCLVCHRRDAIDAAAAAVDAGHFESNDPSLGQEGHVPPPLTGVGAKLRPEWISNTIAHGQRERDYLAVRMPGFGTAFAGRLAPLLGEVDSLPPIEIAPLPSEDKAAEAVREVGRILVGDKGMNCITCHRFGGVQAGSMGAIDLAYTTEARLRPEWFAHFLRAPFRFKPATLMPQFFPDGKSTRPEIADGDVDRQIAGIWHYLAAGRNVRTPSGLHPPPIELTAVDEAVMLRRSVQNTGKRAIAVGLPSGVNLTFDSEALGMNQIWWGRFLDARPVWTSQGSGEAHILTRDPIQLPNGPAIAALDRPDQPWPTATRRERGDRWLGYTLDAARRPSFRYTADDVSVEDSPRERAVAAGVSLERILRLRGDRSNVWLRAASGEDLTLVDAYTVRLGSSIEIHCAATPWQLVPVPGTKLTEARLPLACSTDGSTTTIEYRSQEKGK
jgi:cytochrome c553